MGITFDDEHAPVLDFTTPEIAPAARARARCQCDKARAGGRAAIAAAPRCVSSAGQSPCSRPDFIGELLGLHRHAMKCSGSAGLAGRYGRNGHSGGSSSLGVTLSDLQQQTARTLADSDAWSR